MENFDNLSNNDRLLWQNVFESEQAFVRARMDFMANAKDRVGIIRQALRTHQRGTALGMLFFLPIEERIQVFDELVDLASVGHSDIGLVREAILSLPRDWVVANIEAIAEPILKA